MIAALGLGVVLAGGLWPFGGGARDADATIASLKHKPEIVRDAGVPDGTARARDHYQEFLALPGTPGDMRAESMRRLADLYLAAGEEADLAGDAAASATQYRGALALYQQYLTEFPGRAGADSVLYSMARAHEGVGEVGEALAVLDRLVREFPGGRVAAEAQFRRGERLFVQRDYTAAEQAYGAVVAYGPDGEFYEQALYKQGWSRFKLGDLEACLDPFFAVLARRLAHVTDADGSELLEGLSKPQRELVEDTLRAMSLSVSQLAGIASIDTLLDRRDPVAFADVIYAGLGDLYLGQERYGDAADAYRGFVRRTPAHPRAPYLQARVIAAYTAGRFPTQVLAAKAEYVELYGLHSPYWAGTTPAERPVVIAELKQSLGDLASHDHERAQKSRTPEAYQQAAYWYRRFLEYFPDDPDSAGRNFLLAELLYEGGDFLAATTEYRRVAYGYGAHPQAAEAGYAAILAARAHEKTLDEATRGLWHAAGIEEELRFVASFPEHAQAAAVATSVAEDLFARGELERAVQVAGAVVTRTPPAEEKLERVAWTVFAHAQFDLARYAEAERAYLRLRLFPEPDATRRAGIEERIAASVYRQAEASKAAGDHAAAVAGFLRVAEAAPEATIRPTALFDAAALLMTDQQWTAAAEVLERLRREFPRHALVPDATEQLAVALEAGGRGSDAAREFEAIAALAERPAGVQREALWRAADLYRQAGLAADEQRACEALVKRFPEDFAGAMEARSRLADLARTAGDAPVRRRWLGELVAADAAAGEARTDRSRSLAAHATLELAAPLRDAFVELRLTAPLPKSLKAKKQRLELALAAYGKAAAYDVADVTTAATFETAELYARLGGDLLAADQPAGLTAEELEEYQLLLEEQAFPFEEKAIEVHTVNAERAADGVYDEWVRRSFERLAVLSPARYARTERSESHVADID